MKTIAILLIGLGTGLGLYLSKTNPEQSLDSMFLLIFSGLFFLTWGIYSDKMTS